MGPAVSCVEGGLPKKREGCVAGNPAGAKALGSESCFPFTNWDEPGCQQPPRVTWPEEGFL